MNIDIIRMNADGSTYKAYLHIAYFVLAKPIGKLEPSDFSKN